jgi:hypothetical protein
MATEVPIQHDLLQSTDEEHQTTFDALALLDAAELVIPVNQLCSALPPLQLFDGETSEEDKPTPPPREADPQGLFNIDAQIQMLEKQKDRDVIGDPKRFAERIAADLASGDPNTRQNAARLIKMYLELERIKDQTPAEFQQNIRERMNAINRASQNSRIRVTVDQFDGHSIPRVRITDGQGVLPALEMSGNPGDAVGSN